ncbi:Biofilm associated protein A, partial [Erwinia sp. CPCC 100877]|nr:Biofilm associated protein A [Erwinia sp. CPCC 100877]
MSAQSVNIAVIDNNIIVQAKRMPFANIKKSNALKLKAISGGKYLLTEDSSGVAPENITVKRIGKDLWIILEGQDLEHPQFIIKGFFTFGGELIGKAEDGAFHEYIASDVLDNHEAAALENGESSSLVLGAETVSGLDALVVPEEMMNPWILGLGALAIVGAGLGASGILRSSEHKGKSVGKGTATDTTESKPLLKSELHQITDNEGNIQGSIGRGGVTDDPTPTLSGTGSQPGNIIEIWDNGIKLGETVITQDSSWTFTPSESLSEGEHNFSIVEKDSSGNQGQPTEGWPIVIDTTVPDAPDVTVSDSAGNPVPAGGSTVDDTPTLSGEGEPGDVVTVTDGDKPLGSTVVGEDGSWSLTPETPLDEGEHDLGVTVTDPAGNESPA